MHRPPLAWSRGELEKGAAALDALPQHRPDRRPLPARQLRLGEILREPGGLEAFGQLPETARKIFKMYFRTL